MPTVTEQNLTFVFEDAIDSQKYDAWTHYTGVWNKHPASQKAVDVVAVQTSAAPVTTWMIEAKDFRIVAPATPPKASNVATLPQTMATKAMHTLAGLVHAAANAAVPAEKSLAVKAVSTGTKRIVLHLEPHTGAHTALFPKGFAASVLQQLRRLVKAIDANPLVLNIANTPAAGVPWTVC